MFLSVSTSHHAQSPLECPMPVTHDGRIAARRALLDVVRGIVSVIMILRFSILFSGSVSYVRGLSHQHSSTRSATPPSACEAGADGVAPVLRDIEPFGAELIYAHCPADTDLTSTHVHLY